METQIVLVVVVKKLERRLPLAKVTLRRDRPQFVES